MKYFLGMLALGLLLFAISPLLNGIRIDGVVFGVGELLVNVSATFVALAILAGVYKLIGEEPTIAILKQLIRIQYLAKSIYDAGMDDFRISRREFDPQRMEADLFDSKAIFIASNNFEVIKYARLQRYLTNYLKKPRTGIKLIIRQDSTAISKVVDFKHNLPAHLKERFLIRTIDYLPSGMYGGDDCIYVTLYIRGLTGDESPALLCRRRFSTESCLYNIYSEQFSALWNKGTLVAELERE